jgi:hypothetical protein
VSCHDPERDGQAKTRPFAGRLGREERDEQTVPVIGADTRTIIGDRHPHGGLPVPARSPAGDRQPVADPGRPHRVDGIARQVEQCLLHLRSIESHAG